MNNKITCPYCNCVRLQIVGSSIIGIWKGWKTEVEYICLNDEQHRFKTIKINKTNE